ncbi:MAG: cytochrome c oxidase assembly protein [Acidimicrobiales bacterium]
MSSPAAGADALAPPRWQQVLPRQAVLTAGIVLLVAAVFPLVDLLVRYRLIVETLQFVVLAYAVPPLLVFGLPPRFRERLAGRLFGPRSGQAGARMAKRHGRPLRARSWVMLGAFGLAAILWRVPGVVDAIGRDVWLAFAEAACMVLTGVGLWLELTDSSAAVSAVSSPKKMAMAGVAMWSMWIAAYSLGFSRDIWYGAFLHHGAGSAGLIDEQEIASGLLFLFPFGVFVPVVVSWLIRWLRDEEGPEGELRALISRMQR